MLVLLSEVIQLDPVFGQGREFEQTRFELFGFIGVSVNLLEFLFVIDLIFEAALHNVFSHIFDALNKQETGFQGRSRFLV